MRADAVTQPKILRALKQWHQNHNYGAAERLFLEANAAQQKITGYENGQSIEYLMRLYEESGQEHKDYALRKRYLSWQRDWETTSSGSAWFFNRYAYLAEKRGDLAEATKAYRLVLRSATRGVSPNDVENSAGLDQGIDSFRLLKARALASGASLSSETGIASLSQAVRIAPSNPAVRYRYALALFKSRRYRMAKAEFVKVLAENPDDGVRQQVTAELQLLATCSEPELDKWENRKPIPHVPRN